MFAQEELGRGPSRSNAAASGTGMKEQICLRCNRAYMAKRKQRYCTKECQRLRMKMRGRLRTKACEGCGQPFTFTIKGGRDRRLCGGVECKRTHFRKLWAARAKRLGVCRIAGCARPAGYVQLGLCTACAYRLRRKGTTDYAVIKRALRRKDDRGYIQLYRPEHGLADTAGYVYEHRLVAYEIYGPAPHNCRWCAVELPHWAVITVDHLNERKDDNAEDNLVLACNTCNRVRGALAKWVCGLTHEAFGFLIDSLDKARIGAARQGASDLSESARPALACQPHARADVIGRSGARGIGAPEETY